ncbi:unnamed protein product [Chrysoparadoxa australica]
MWKWGRKGDKDGKALRDAQIAGLLQVPGIQQKAGDGSMMELGVAAPPEGRQVVMRIFLPARFPEERPVLQLVGHVQHHWVNQYMQVVGHPQLTSWEESPKQLSNVIQDVIQEFRSKCPPVTGQPIQMGQQPMHVQPVEGYAPVPTPMPTYNNYNASIPGQMNQGYTNPQWNAAHVPMASPQQPYAQPSHHQAGQSLPQQQHPQQLQHPEPKQAAPEPKKERQRPVHHTPIPPIPNEFEELAGMTYAQLQRLVEDDVARKALVESMPSVLGMMELRRDLIKGNAQAAQVNIKAQEELQELRAETTSLQVILAEAKETYDEQAKELKSGLGLDANHEILRKVKDASKAKNKQSDQTADSFLNGEMPVADFIEKFMEEREAYHQLAAKGEALKREIHF